MLGFEEAGSAQAMIAKSQCQVLSLPLNVSTFRILFYVLKVSFLISSK